MLAPDDAWTTELDGTRVAFGEGALAGVGERVQALGCRAVLLVTDPGIRAAGHVEVALRALADAAVRARVFDGVAENPSTLHVEEGRSIAAAAGVDGIVAIGGGSALDCAKGVNFLLTQGGRMEDYWGRERATKPMLPAVGVPTTAGTGSEAQRFALISQPGSGIKMACGDRKARFAAVLLDPALLATTPPGVAAMAGLDAAAHAVESHVSRAGNPLSRLFAREAWRLVESSLAEHLADPAAHAPRCRMSLGAFLAGAAIEHSMLGAAHACANPLTARHGVAHGTAVGVMLPHVVRFNAERAGELYAELAPGGAPELARRFGELRAAAGIAARLRDCGVPADGLDDLAAEAEGQWTAGFNPRPVTRRELRELYEAAY